MGKKRGPWSSEDKGVAAWNHDYESSITGVGTIRLYMKVTFETTATEEDGEQIWDEAAVRAENLLHALGKPVKKKVKK